MIRVSFVSFGEEQVCLFVVYVAVCRSHALERVRRGMVVRAQAAGMIQPCFCVLVEDNLNRTYRSIYMRCFEEATDEHQGQRYGASRLQQKRTKRV